MQETNRGRILALTVLCGTTFGLGSVASGQDVINITGATLLENLVSAEASTNDWLDVDGDGFCGDTSICAFDPDQLAPFGLPPGGDPEQVWMVQYRVVGSVNGFQELVDWGRPFFAHDPPDTQPDPVNEPLRWCTSTGVIDPCVAALAYHNRDLYIIGGDSQLPPGGIADLGAPGSAPVNMTEDGQYSATTTPAADGVAGYQADIAPVDVPASWAVQSGGVQDVSPFRTPLQSGYGKNPAVSTDKQGNANGLDQLLATLGGLTNPLASRNLYDGDPNGGAAENGNTIFSTSLAFAPIGAWTNHGTGFRQLGISDFRYTTTTGRLPTGENIIQITRDSGSGTRNGFMNSIGIDPSWGSGENIGPQSVGSAFRIVGPDFLPSNKGGSSELEGTLQNVRLGLGYSGAERYVNRSRFGRMELLAVANDVDFGDGTSTVFSRPNIDAVLDNDIDGWRIGGPATLNHLGDPRSSLPCADGVPAKGNDGVGNTNPAMSNRAAAEYLNNITRSIENFQTVPLSPDNEFMPGELVATLIIPPTALDYFLANINIPTGWATPNPVGFNQNLQDEVRSLSDLGDFRYYAYGLDGLNGVVPTRTTGVAYSDATAPGASATGQFYVNQAGASLSYASAMDDRNRIAGDFNGDGERNWLDAEEMMKAYNQRHAAGPVWNAPNGTMTPDNGNTAGSFACIEILGDYNCDGSFDEQDVRYWADGLAVDPTTRVLSRVQGFTRVDNASAALKAVGDLNFFGTTLANPNATYDAGDSRADVAGSGGHTPAFQPIGQDGTVGAEDIDYVFANFGDWTVLGDAVGLDLSCDMNDDFLVNHDDVCIILGILETTSGDVDLNGTVDASDRAIAENTISTLGGVGGWALGDVTGDGIVDQADLDVIDGVSDPCAVPPLCVGDIDGDGDTDVFDFGLFGPAFGTSTGDAGYLPEADFDNSGTIDVFDFGVFAPDFGCGV